MMLGTRWSSKKQILIFVLERCNKEAVKHSTEKPILIIFMNLSKIGFP